MKKSWIGKTIIALVVIGLLVAGGFAAYRLGYVHGFSAASSGDMSSFWVERFDDMPHGGYFGDMDDFRRDGSWMMPGSRYPGSYMDGYSSPFNRNIMGHGSLFFFSPFLLLVRIAFWGFVIWLIYKFVTGRWKFSVTPQPAAGSNTVDVTPEE